MNINAFPEYVKIGVIIGLCLFIIFGVVYLNPIAFAMILIAGMFLVIMTINPRYGLFGLLILRTITDLFKDEALYTIEGYPLNIASLVSLGVFVTGLLTLSIHLLIYKDTKQQKSQSSFITKLFFIWILTSFISVLISKNNTQSAIEYLRIFDFFIIFLLAKKFIREIDHFRELVKTIFISSIIPIIIAYYQIFTGQGASDTAGITFRIQSTFAHSNLFAFYLVFLLTFLLITFFTTNKSIMKLLLGLYIIIAFIPLIFTFTRAAWLSIIFIIIILSIVRFQSLFLILPFGSLPLFLFLPAINNRIYDLLHWKEDSSILWRLKLWDIMTPYIKAKPFFGYGLDQFTSLSSQMIGFAMPAHNDYIKIAIEMGITGFLGYILLLLVILWHILILAKTTLNPYLKNITSGIVALLLVYLFISSVDNLIEATALQWIFWSILGGIMGIEKYFRKDTSTPTVN